MSGEKHGRPQRSTFRYGGAQVSLVHESENQAMLVGLISQNRRQGEATAVMLEAMNYADEQGISLWLEAQQYGDWRTSMSNEQLIRFYERFGFDLVVDNRRPRWMTREPLVRGNLL